MSRPLTPAEEGASLFLHASMAYPANADKQAEFIADACRRKGKNPQQLGKALLANERLLRGLVKSANAAHRRRGVPGQVRMFELIGVVNTVFGGK